MTGKCASEVSACQLFAFGGKPYDPNINIRADFKLFELSVKLCSLKLWFGLSLEELLSALQLPKEPGLSE